MAQVYGAGPCAVAVRLSATSPDQQGVVGVEGGGGDADAAA